ncbi:MAG: rubrerythrin family protein [Anaerolineae bacterium]|jgi:rubrerythrin
MHPMTEANLKSAYAGESQAHMRYLAWADKAERDGFPAVARLFRAVSWAEQIHATNHFMVLRNEVGDDQTVAGAVFGYGPTAQNLTGAIGGEEFEVAEMYPAYIAVAKLQGETSAVRSFEWALEAEKTHAALYTQAKAAVEAGNDPAFEVVNVCSRCGHTLVSEAPDMCPVCGAKKEAFRAF